MQSYISHHARGTVFYHLINYLSSKSCPIDLLRKILEIIGNMIFSLIFVLRKIWYFRQLRKIKKIWYLRWAFLQKCCFSCSVNNNPNDALVHFLKIINKLLDKHAPYKTIKYYKPQYGSKAWITPGLTNSLTNCTKVSAKKKIQKQKDVSKSNSNHAVIIYPHCLERQNLVITSNILKTLTTKS